MWVVVDASRWSGGGGAADSKVQGGCELEVELEVGVAGTRCW